MLNPIQRHLKAYLAAFGALKWTASLLNMTIIQAFICFVRLFKATSISSALNGWAVLGLEEQKLGMGEPKENISERPTFPSTPLPIPPPPIVSTSAFPSLLVSWAWLLTVARCVSVYLESIVGVDAAPAALLQLHLWVKIFLVLLHDVREVGPPAALCVILLTVAVVVRVVLLERRRQKKQKKKKQICHVKTYYFIILENKSWILVHHGEKTTNCICLYYSSNKV